MIESFSNKDALTYVSICSGYLPPEYIEKNVLSNKLDIFSLGVVMLNVIAGPRGRSRSAEMSSQEFTDLVRNVVCLYQDQ